MCCGQVDQPPTSTEPWSQVALAAGLAALTRGEDCSGWQAVGEADVSSARQQIFISNPRNFLHSSCLPTAVTSELLNFPVTLLGDVRKAILNA